MAVTPMRPREGTLIPTTIRLGDYEYLVVPQRIGRLKKRLGKALGALTQFNTESLEGFVGESLERAHAILAVFIPDLMPVYEFCGYKSKAAWEAGDDEDDGDYGPTIPEVVDAFEVVMQVNRLDLLGHLRSVIPPDLIRAAVTAQVAQSVREGGAMTSSLNTSSTPGPDTPLTTSGPTTPTSASSTA